ncbi:tRNA lysidine(34) synthetase TilS [Ginsengibacter hankyongi]|uniref:tRNA(Ile)-lysidine synthase n=1 Tax=Ginsengibacter hankyongi TaxID=2607284 RepID=A0A5J5IDN2_9BACT|nr:tRNA lysidine(34) synthetase TilS [Ginsengibacter hankyongi]KAA9037742.1 tRNA lysidine(34) synthetase TilS [Ginsengibacter hankyongi]
MSFLQKFIDKIQKENLFQKKDQLLLAVSGGIDSIVLCELCSQAGFEFKIAHCNFQLRGEESERDEAFVKSLGERYSTEIFIKKFDTEKYAEEKKISIQVAARELRYEWFEELIASTTGKLEPTTKKFSETSNNKHRTLYILTAHHANDNIETLLMNFFKGTGIKGLQGIPVKQRKIIRPLLFAKRGEILAFSKVNSLSFVEDSSNLSDKYTRNYFRNQLIPSIRKVFPEVEDNLLHAIERFKEIGMLYEQAIQLHKKKLLEYKEHEIHIPVLKLLKSIPLKTIIYEIIKEYGFTAHQTDDVLHLLKSESGKYISSSMYKIIKDRKWIIISPHNSLQAATILIDKNDNKIVFENGELEISKFVKSDTILSTESSIATLDAKDIIYPLLLRKWKQGDYFYPLGTKNLPAGRPGKKKLSRFFIDQKLSLTEKEKIWVIESNKRIIWVVGKRIDDRFKITGSTTNVLKISFNER